MPVLAAHRVHLAVFGVLVLLGGCRIPAEPPGGYAVVPPPASDPVDVTDEAIPNPDAPRAADPNEVERAELEAEARRRLEDPAACLRDFGGAAPDAATRDELRSVASDCDRAGLDQNQCMSEAWLTREAAECLAVTRTMDPAATVTSSLVVDRRRGKVIWQVRGELVQGESTRTWQTWEVELDAHTGAMLGIRQSQSVAGSVRP